MPTIVDGVVYLTPAEAAKWLDMNVASLRNQRSDGRTRMEYIKHLGRVLYPHSEVKQYAREIDR
ncbi:helix-turn-helix domain-containing protein [Polymorphospora sp. NPDC050346]|uniref:helix-turn-helix domain-containing protein n=1 Tax=Polymorphospora sp. NPDC050346 TaxID=3155780 RepID=UPI0033D7CE7B